LQCWGFPSNAYLWTGQLEALRDCMAHLEVVLAHEADPVRRWYGDWTLAMIASFFDRATFPRRTAQLSEDADAIGSPEPLSAAAFLEGRVLALQDPPDLDGAMRWYRKSLEHARSFESPGMEATALGWILHGCAALDEREADLLCNQAITSQYELRYWALIWLSLYDTAAHLNRSGRTEPAAVVIGHLEAFQSPMLLMGAATLGEDVAAALSGPSVERWKAAGAAMDRNELVRYALRVLDPTSD